MTGRTMKSIAIGLILIFGLGAPAWSWGDEDQPMMLWDGTWVCSTPEAYDQAVDLERNTDKSFRELKKDLLERKLCIYIDGGDVARCCIVFVLHKVIFVFYEQIAWVQGGQRGEPVLGNN